MVQWLRRRVCIRLPPGANPVLTSDQDLLPVVLHTTLPPFVNSQLVASCQLGFLIMFPISLNCLFQLIKKKWSASEIA